MQSCFVTVFPKYLNSAAFSWTSLYTQIVSHRQILVSFSSGVPLPIQRSGNSLFRNEQTRRKKWGGEPSNWKNIPTGTRCKAMLSIIARRVSSVSLAPSFSWLDCCASFLLGFCKRQCLSWKGAKHEQVAEQKRRSCRVRDQWNACKYLARNWELILSWYVSCH